MQGEGARGMKVRKEGRREERREGRWPSLLLFTCIETGGEVVSGVVTGGKVKGGNVKEDPGGGQERIHCHCT